MVDWDANSPQLEQNLRRVLEAAREAARRRELPSLQSMRRWHAEVHSNLDAPDPRYVGKFRGEPGLEIVQVHVGGQYRGDSASMCLGTR